MRRLVAAVSIVAAMALGGCEGAGGQTVSVEGASLTIPDGWVDTGENALDDGDGFVMYMPNQDMDEVVTDYVIVSWSDERYADGGVGDLEQTKGYTDGFSYERVGSADVDGASSCEVYSVSDGQTSYDRAYVVTPETDYYVEVCGSAVTIDSILDSMSVE